MYFTNDLSFNLISSAIQCDWWLTAQTGVRFPLPCPSQTAKPSTYVASIPVSVRLKLERKRPVLRGWRRGPASFSTGKSKGTVCCSHVGQEVGSNTTCLRKGCVVCQEAVGSTCTSHQGHLSKEAGPLVWGCVASKAITGKILWKGPPSWISTGS